MNATESTSETTSERNLFPVQIQMSHKLTDALDALAEEEGQSSRSAVVRRACWQFIRQQKPLLPTTQEGSKP